MVRKKHLALLVTALISIGIIAVIISKPSNQTGRGEQRIQNALALSEPNPYANLNPGIDISFPQCKQDPIPMSGFTIIGVTNGRAFTTNPCLKLEYQQASGSKTPISFYINLDFPSATSNSTDRGSTGPRGKCTKNNMKCQGYNYGWNAAADAKTYVDSLWFSSKIWWLDIETYNSWDFNGELNNQTIQAAIDFFHKDGLTVGIYTVPRMWAAITDGDYDPDVPTWIAGASSQLEAKNFCGISIGSGPTWLSQYSDGGAYDRNLVC